MEPQDETQADRFVKAARELGADGDAKDFDKTLKELAKAPPPDTVKARKKHSKRDAASEKKPS